MGMACTDRLGGVPPRAHIGRNLFPDNSVYLDASILGFAFYNMTLR
jgi:hypothetical protein